MTVMITVGCSQSRSRCGLRMSRDTCATAIPYLGSSYNPSIVPPRRLEPPGGVATWR